MLHKPFYDPEKSYEENYDKGPFSFFSNASVYTQPSEPKYTFLGQPLFLPFGIPAGPLLNSKFIKGAFENGFDVAVYKTVRSSFYPCHPFPNVLSVNVKGDLDVEKMKKNLVAGNIYKEPLSITNSFGVPSKEPAIWQKDVKKALTYVGKGQLLILSFMGTVRENQTQKQFIDDYILAAKLAYETGVKVLEVNLSCPNIGNEGLVCYNIPVTTEVLKGIRKVIGNVPLVVKIGYYQSDEELEKIARIVNEYANDIAAINTLQATVVDKKGNPALPGKNRLKSGVCGTAIQWAGLEMVRRLRAIRAKNNFSFSITGVGGVTTAEDYFEYKKAGADCIMSATGAMWNPLLAKEIKHILPE
jgi:dihydroorotate dehydrogenase